MKITRLETIMVEPRWLFLKIHTDEGLVGYGEPILEGRARTVATAVSEMEEYLIGQNPLDINRHWQVLYRGTFYRGGPVLTSALSGVEQALWDIKGKYHGVPCYELLGGAVRERVRVYAHSSGNSLEEFISHAQSQVELGFTALKTSFAGPVRELDTPAFIKGCVARIEAIRTSLPDHVDLAVDLHGRFSPAMSIRLAKELEPYNLLFLEEPCLPENIDALARIAQTTSIPIAAGERLFTRWGFRELLEKQAAAVLQPDPCHCGGIQETIRIANMAEMYYAALAPHNPLGPIALAVCLQIDACVPNFLCQEQVCLGEGYLKEPFQVKNGYIELPQKPGLGIELDEEALQDKIREHNWVTPRLFHADDGSFAEW